MSTYRINMARDFVMPLDSRKKWLSWFFIYLVASSVVIAAVLHDVLREYSVCQAQRDALESREKRFFSWHPDYRTPGQCKVALQAKLMAALRDVEGLVEFESGKTSMAKILFGLAVALPQGVDLGAVDFEGTERKLNFEVLMTVRSKEEDKFSATSQVAAWEREPLLAGRLVQIEVENSERVKRDGMEMMCWRFSASVGEK